MHLTHVSPVFATADQRRNALENQILVKLDSANVVIIMNVHLQNFVFLEDAKDLVFIPMQTRQIIVTQQKVCANVPPQTKIVIGMKVAIK